jgi:hypothetical protein
MLFDLIEEAIKAAIKHPDVTEVWVEVQARVNPVWFASAILIFFCFIPFFAFREIVRIEGGEKVKGWFLGEVKK